MSGNQHNILIPMVNGPFKDILWSQTIGVTSTLLVLTHGSWTLLTSWNTCCNNFLTIAIITFGIIKRKTTKFSSKYALA